MKVENGHSDKCSHLMTSHELVQCYVMPQVRNFRCSMEQNSLDFKEQHAHMFNVKDDLLGYILYGAK